MTNLVWLITGCSSGLGHAFVQSVLAKGDQVIATSRGDASTRLADLAKLGAKTKSLDVTWPAERLQSTVAEAVAIYGRIDVLLNNAGYIDGGVFEEISSEFMIKALTTNVLGPLALTRALLPYMRERKSGTILWQSSVGAYYGAPGSCTYSGGKGLLETIVPTIGMEVAAWNIRVCLLVPGYYKTDVMSPGNIRFDAPNRLLEYEEMNKLVVAGCAAADGNQPGDPRKAADIVVDAVHGDGVAAGKTLPLRLPLGPDGIKAVRANCEAKLQICDEWEEIVSTTNLAT